MTILFRARLRVGPGNAMMSRFLTDFEARLALGIGQQSVETQICIQDLWSSRHYAVRTVAPLAADQVQICKLTCTSAMTSLTPRLARYTVGSMSEFVGVTKVRNYGLQFFHNGS